MKVSARNVLEGRVTQVVEGAINAEVALELDGGEALVAVITLQSLKRLEIVVGSTAIAMIKAPWVTLMTDHEGLRLSARNCLSGKVESVSDGAVNAEVALTLKGGERLYAIVTRPSVEALGLTEGVAATAVIKASHILLATREKSAI